VDEMDDKQRQLQQFYNSTINWSFRLEILMGW